MLNKKTDAACVGLIDIPYPIVVEGKYDKIRLASITNAPVITTDGFGLFRNKKKLAYLRSLCDSLGAIIILTDSDGAGLLIRSYLRTALGEGRQIYNVYIPQVEGKERRKAAPSKAGYLGVEGIDSDELRRILSDFLSTALGGGSAAMLPMLRAPPCILQKQSCMLRE